MRVLKVIWPPVVWFLLATYVIVRVVYQAPKTELDIVFAAWLGGIVSVACVIVAMRLWRDRKRV